MTTRTNKLSQLQIIYTIHHRFEYVGWDHITHHSVVIKHGYWSAVSATHHSGWIFFQFGHTNGQVGKNALHNKDLK